MAVSQESSQLRHEENAATEAEGKLWRLFVFYS